MAEQNSQNPIDYGEVLHSWEIPEFHRPVRGRWWYITASLVFFFLLAYAIFSQNFLFALIILLFAAVIFMHSIREPLYLDFAVTNKGIVLNNRLYDYENLEYFWIVNQPPLVPNIYFQFKSAWRPPLSVHLKEDSVQEIKNTLREFLSENEGKKDEPISDLLWKVFKL